MSERPQKLRPVYHDTTAKRSRLVRREELLTHRPDLAACFDDADAGFPVRVTRSFAQRANLSDPRDPLAIQALPDPRETLVDEHDLSDPVGDQACSPIPWVVHKYPNRALLITTKRCHLMCRYCFRRDHNPNDAQDPTPAEWEHVLAWVDGQTLDEVILSGGDPLMLSDRRLFDTLDRLAHVPIRRIHTRAPITFPERVTPRLVEGLLRAGPLWVVVHCNHPKELAPDVDEALRRLVDAGVPVLNQSVLLAGVNDDVSVLAELSRALLKRRVFPYYLHVTDRARGNAHLRVSLSEARALHDALKKQVSGMGLPALAFDAPDGSGKVDAHRVPQ